MRVAVTTPAVFELAVRLARLARLGLPSLAERPRWICTARVWDITLIVVV
jgi:hypothetical protein